MRAKIYSASSLFHFGTEIGSRSEGESKAVTHSHKRGSLDLAQQHLHAAFSHMMTCDRSVGSLLACG